MAKGIDHLVLAVNSLPEAAAIYRRMGFCLTPRAVHPFGTANRLVQLDGVFLEVLEVADAGMITATVPERFSFAAFIQDYLGGGEGLSFLVMDSSDVAGDHRAAIADGLQTWPVFDFSRTARLPGGDDVTVSFSLNFIGHKDMPRAGFFTCHQHTPEHFWKAEYQSHENSARTVLDVSLVAERPENYRRFLQKFTRSDTVQVHDGRLVINTARGSVSILTPGAFEEFYGQPAPDISTGPCFGGYMIGVASLAKCKAVFETAKMDYSEHAGHCVVPASGALGTTIAFKEVP